MERINSSENGRISNTDWEIHKIYAESFSDKNLKFDGGRNKPDRIRVNKLPADPLKLRPIEPGQQRLKLEQLALGVK